MWDNEFNIKYRSQKYWTMNENFMIDYFKYNVLVYVVTKNILKPKDKDLKISIKLQHIIDVNT